MVMLKLQINAGIIQFLSSDAFFFFSFAEICVQYVPNEVDR